MGLAEQAVIGEYVLDDEEGQHRIHRGVFQRQGKAVAVEIRPRSAFVRVGTIDFRGDVQADITVHASLEHIEKRFLPAPDVQHDPRGVSRVTPQGPVGLLIEGPVWGCFGYHDGSRPPGKAAKGIGNGSGK